MKFCERRDAALAAVIPAPSKVKPPGLGWVLATLWAILLLSTFLRNAAAQLPGAIYVSDRSGTTVNANLFHDKEDVYLNGGPQSGGGAQLPDGNYHFQVTDPSGVVLLSTDAIAMRQLKVVGGYVLGAVLPGHANGDPWPTVGMTIRQGVQLAPFAQTPNPGGVYKVWLTPVERYTPGAGNFGFLNDWSKTDNFKVFSDLDDPATTLVIRKYHDIDGDGTRDPGEPGLPDWRFQVVVTDVNGELVATTPADPTTGADGEVTLQTEGLPALRYPLQWTVREVQGGSPWRQTEPSESSPGAAWIDGQWCWTGTDAAGGTVVVEFGNAQFASLGGVKFHDRNGNGVREPLQEPGLPGFQFQIVATLPNGTVLVQDVVSGTDGQWSAGPFVLGTLWSVKEQAPEVPWRQTCPADGGGYAGMLVADHLDLDFGNARFFRLAGVKYHDSNGNGTWDAGESPLDDWTFLIAIDGTPAETVVSGPDGRWSSSGEYLEGSLVTVTERPRKGWEQTEPAGGLPATGFVGIETEYRFGNARVFPILGEKYHDRNGSGVRDESEPGLSGFVFRGTIVRGDGLVSILDTVSMENGLWGFPAVREGSTYSVVEILDGVADWEQTEPAGGAGYTGVVVDTTYLRFGNIRIARLAGRKYYDRDKNGTIGPGDALSSGLGGIPIVIDVVWNGNPSVRETVLTNTDGTWQTVGRFREGSEFVVREQPGSNWFQLFPAGAWSGRIASEPWLIGPDGIVRGLDFLNVQLGAGGGLTLGFWSNRNGLWALTNGPSTLESNLAFLRSLNLVNASGAAFDPTTAAQFQQWLLDGSAKNMAYALSVQMAAMALNVRIAPVRNANGSIVGGVDPKAVIWAPGTVSGGSMGFATVEAILAEANQLLGQTPLIGSGHPMRTRAEALKNALDRANNNRGFVLDFPV